MNDKEIIKALEYCSDNKSCIGSKCPAYNYSANCTVDLMKETLDLINRQKAEIERLNAENMLTMAERNAFRKSFYEMCKKSKTAKSEAVKEFSKSLIDKTHGKKISSTDILDFAVDYVRGENNG